MTENNPGVNNHITYIECQIQEVFLELEEIVRKKAAIRDETGLEAVENEIVRVTDRPAGLITALKIQQALDSEDLKQEASGLIKAHPKKMKNQGFRDVEVRPSRGESVSVTACYYSRKGKKKGKKKRAGIYPGLYLLGIHDHCSPGPASEISLMATVLSSFEEARQILNDRGLEIDSKTIREITLRFAKRAEAAGRHDEAVFAETLAGCRAVVSTDGGRIRIRRDKPGPKTKKGRSHYHTSWREPKLLIIYTVNEKGETDRTISPFIDGTLKGPNAVFGLIGYYLSRLDICSADKILFIADGARWIWNRVPGLVSLLGLSYSQFYELVDFYHAAEHLGKVAGLQKGWKSSDKKNWVKKYRKLLLKGKTDEVIEAINHLCKTRRIKNLRRELNYFIRNQKRMQYDKIAEEGLPLGSGAMESAIRRVVNLRLKGAAIFWLRETAEAMLMLRSYYKAGRWNMLKKMAFSTQMASTV